MRAVASLGTETTLGLLPGALSGMAQSLSRGESLSGGLAG